MRHLALKNIQGHKAYNVIIVFAVALALTMVFAAAFMTGGVQNELENTRRLQEPDLAVVPSGTKESGQLHLTQGPPAQGAVPSGVPEQLAQFSDIEAVAVQKQLGSAVVGNVRVKLTGYEPATDFVVQPWLDKKSSPGFRERSAGVVLGARVAVGKAPGDKLELNGENLLIAGRMQETGAFPDTSVFIPLPAGQMAEPSWILLRLQRGAFLDAVVNRLEANIAGIEVITRPELLKTINDQLYGLLQGGSANIAALLVVIGVLLITGALFALMVHGRRREFGLLKAMGAGNSFVFRLIICEAVMLGGIGGVLGIALSAIWLMLSNTGFVSAELSSLSFLGSVLCKLAVTLAVTVAVGILTALYPALIASRLEPYAAIRSGE
ncbi:MAG: ABC transporter permease [Deltaproteobacteria bacterium]|jgi:putative ABC transport system permease protein|nr:ABC transporter permease [Deltaproteobacteria bacterium]